MLKKVVSVYPVSAWFRAGDRGGGRAGRMGRAEAVEGLPKPVLRLPGVAQGALGGARTRGHLGSQASSCLIRGPQTQELQGEMRAWGSPVGR